MQQLGQHTKQYGNNGSNGNVNGGYSSTDTQSHSDDSNNDGKSRKSSSSNNSSSNSSTKLSRHHSDQEDLASMNLQLLSRCAMSSASASASASLPSSASSSSSSFSFNGMYTLPSMFTGQAKQGQGLGQGLEHGQGFGQGQGLTTKDQLRHEMVSQTEADEGKITTDRRRMWSSLTDLFSSYPLPQPLSHINRSSCSLTLTLTHISLILFSLPSSLLTFCHFSAPPLFSLTINYSLLFPCFLRDCIVDGHEWRCQFKCSYLQLALSIIQITSSFSVCEWSSLLVVHSIGQCWLLD